MPTATFVDVNNVRCCFLLIFYYNAHRRFLLCQQCPPLFLINSMLPMHTAISYYVHNAHRYVLLC